MGRSVTFWRIAYQQHGAAVMAFLASRTHHREDAEDLLHETFVRAIKAGERLRDTASVKTYLFTIAHRLTIDRHRRRREMPLAGDDHAQEALQNLVDPGSERIEERAAHRQTLARVLATLPELPPKLRTAFELGVIEKRPYREIAETTGWSMAQVKVNIHRARKHVLAALPSDTDDRGGTR